MNILAFAEVCKYATVRSYIISLSKGFSNNPEVQDDLYYTAWMAIIEQEGDYTVECYCEVAHKAMNRKYVLYYMPEPKVYSDGYERRTLDYSLIKTARIKRRYFKRKDVNLDKSV